jgi:hypothetical protein|tara:strand:- start:6 stop:164 length:159 start_codon:yes stop_codon:yes gene_type:complete
MLLESVIRDFFVQRIFMIFQPDDSEISVHEAEVQLNDLGKLSIVEFDSPGMR